MVKLNLRNIFNFKNGKIILAIFLFILLMISLVKCFMSSIDKREGVTNNTKVCPDNCYSSNIDQGILFPSVFDGSVNGFYTIPKYTCGSSSTDANPVYTSGSASNEVNAAINGNCWRSEQCIQCGQVDGYKEKRLSSRGEQDISFNQIKIVDGCPRINWCDDDSTGQSCVDTVRKNNLNNYFDTPKTDGTCIYGQVLPSYTQPKTILPFEYRKCKALATYDCSENVNIYKGYRDSITNPEYLRAQGITNSFSSSSQYGGFGVGDMAGSGSLNWLSNNSTGTISLTDDIIPPGTNLSNAANIKPDHCGPNSVLKRRADGSWYCTHKHPHGVGEHHSSS